LYISCNSHVAWLTTTAAAAAAGGHIQLLHVMTVSSVVRDVVHSTLLTWFRHFIADIAAAAAAIMI